MTLKEFQLTAVKSLFVEKEEIILKEAKTGLTAGFFIICRAGDYP